MRMPQPRGVLGKTLAELLTAPYDDAGDVAELPAPESADDAARVVSVLERLKSVSKADGGLYKFTADDDGGFVWAARRSTYDFSNVKIF